MTACIGGVAEIGRRLKGEGEAEGDALLSDAAALDEAGEDLGFEGFSEKVGRGRAGVAVVGAHGPVFAESVTDAGAHLETYLEDSSALERWGVAEVVGRADDADIR